MFRFSFYRFLETFSGYNDWKRHKKGAPVLSMESLKVHSSLLFDLLSLPFTNTWEFKEILLNLTLAFNQYAAFLEKTNREQKERQRLNQPSLQTWDIFL